MDRLPFLLTMKTDADKIFVTQSRKKNRHNEIHEVFLQKPKDSLAARPTGGKKQ